MIAPETAVERAELLHKLDAALTWGTSWQVGTQVELVAPNRDRWTVQVLDEERAELQWLHRGYGVAQVLGWPGSSSGLALPPDLARRVWEVSRRLTASAVR